MTSQTLNSVGLLLSIFGTLLAFFFGFPQPSHERGVALGVEDGTVFTDGTSVAEVNSAVDRRRKRYTIISYFAVLLLMAGFVCQLIAVRMQ